MFIQFISNNWKIFLQLILIICLKIYLNFQIKSLFYKITILKCIICIIISKIQYNPNKKNNLIYTISRYKIIVCIDRSYNYKNILIPHKNTNKTKKRKIKENLHENMKIKIYKIDVNFDLQDF